MKWVVLSNNRGNSTEGCLQSSNENRLSTEHGLSIFLETERYKILLDTGASDVFIRNAMLLGIDLSTVDFVFISHGHSDHAGGLKYFVELNHRAKIIVSPYAMNCKFYSKRNVVHSITTTWPENIADRLIEVDESCEPAQGLHVIAHIPHIHPMPKGNQHLFVEDINSQTTNARGQFDTCIDNAERGVQQSQYLLDDFRHELALYIDGLLFTGCAHSGLENILSACPWHVSSVVGGFHLLDGQESEEELLCLAERLNAKYQTTRFYTSHCTGDYVFNIMKSVMGEQLQSFSCGTIIEKE